MTTNQVVADDVLGRVSRKLWELAARLVKGMINPDRVNYFLQMALEGPRRPQVSRGSGGTYVLETEWTYDSTHREYVTITHEEGDARHPLELLGLGIDHPSKQRMMENLRKLFMAQVPSHGSRRMVRLYRVLATKAHYTSSLLSPGDTVLSRDVYDVHLMMQPICDFSDGQPIPCLKGMPLIV